MITLGFDNRLELVRPGGSGSGRQVTRDHVERLNRCRDSWLQSISVRFAARVGSLGVTSRCGAPPDPAAQRGATLAGAQRNG